jgi:hypothetical protein
MKLEDIKIGEIYVYINDDYPRLNGQKLIAYRYYHFVDSHTSVVFMSNDGNEWFVSCQYIHEVNDEVI